MVDIVLTIITLSKINTILHIIFTFCFLYFIFIHCPSVEGFGKGEMYWSLFLGVFIFLLVLYPTKEELYLYYAAKNADNPNQIVEVVKNIREKINE